MKALVTGGCGFIGSHLTEKLLNEGFQVVVVDNLVNSTNENLAHLQSDQLRIYNEDINDDIKLLFKDIDYVFHLAALADIVPSVQYPERYFKANVNGTYNILECARKANIKKFMYAASASCYGIPDVYPTPESTPTNPQYPYALTKLLAEEMVMHWGLVYKLPVISLRLFNVYGLRSRTSGAYGAVFGVFLAQKLAGKPFTIVGDGTQTRDFTFVTDVANAFYKASISNLTQDIFNVGSGGTYSINYLVELLEGDREYIPKRPGEPDCTFADIRKIQNSLDWRPMTTFEEGVKIIKNNIHYWDNAPVWDKNTIDEATKDWFQYLQ